MVTILCGVCDRHTDVRVEPADIPTSGLVCPFCGATVPVESIDVGGNDDTPAGMIDHDPEDWLAEAAERIARHPFSPQSRSGGY